MHFPIINSKSRCKSSLLLISSKRVLGFCLILFAIISLVPFPSLVLARSKTLISDSNRQKHSNYDKLMGQNKISLEARKNQVVGRRETATSWDEEDRITRERVFSNKNIPDDWKRRIEQGQMLYSLQLPSNPVRTLSSLSLSLSLSLLKKKKKKKKKSQKKKRTKPKSLIQKLYPPISNGYLGTFVNFDSIYAAGIYVGTGLLGTTHR